MLKREDFNSCLDEISAWRRDFHRHPELGLQEFRTSGKIVEILQSFGVEVVSDFCETAVVAIIRGKNEHPVVGIRADIDALAMQDEKDVEYKSQNPGVAHSCGHDAHIAIALEICKYLKEHAEDLAGTVKVVFQPAEEGPTSGARMVMETGIVDDVDVMFGYHVLPTPIGQVNICEGIQNGCGDNFAITITGEGAHAAYPQKAHDPIIIASDMIQAFQHIISREIDPDVAAVLSISYIQAGNTNACNVIPSKVLMGGTLRTVDPDVRNFIYQRMNEIGENLCKMYHSEFHMDWEQVSPVLKNDPKIAGIYKRCAEAVVGNENINIITHTEMSYDDFAFYANAKPASFLEFGSGHPEGTECYFNHHPKFDIDENGLTSGLAIVLNAVLTYCNEY